MHDIHIDLIRHFDFFVLFQFIHMLFTHILIELRVHGISVINFLIFSFVILYTLHQHITREHVFVFSHNQHVALHSDSHTALHTTILLSP